MAVVSALKVRRPALRWAFVVYVVLVGLAGAAQSSAAATATGPPAAPVPGPNGLGVYDGATGVTWLADADLAASNRFGLPVCSAATTTPCVNPSGSMNYRSAVAWVDAMRSADYLGHANWQLPTTPNSEPRTSTICPR